MNVPAVGPVTVLTVVMVPVTSVGFVIAARVVEPVTVENVEVVLLEIVEEALLVEEANTVVDVVGVVTVT